MKAIFAICGNDGTGKTTVTNMINSKFTDIKAICRDTSKEERFNLDIDFLDKLTLKYTFEDRQYELVDHLSTSKTKVYWIILDNGLK